MITKQDIQNALQENFPTRHIKILDVDGMWEVLVDGNSILPDANGTLLLQICNSTFDLTGLCDLAAFAQAVTVLTEVINDKLQQILVDEHGI